MIEFNLCEFLNAQKEFNGLGEWHRQDPGFPDVIFEGNITPTPGLEVKAWFPLATEITARFKDSQNHFVEDKTYVVVLAWLPEFVIFGRPKILDLLIATGASVARARDMHYHKPPDYLVLEPEDTKTRTRNLQQTNTNGFKWQPAANPKQEAANRERAAQIVASWGDTGITYSPTAEYQAKLRELIQGFTYRLDTNYAKMDRIGHDGIDSFARKVYAMPFHGRSVADWSAILSSQDNARLRKALEEAFDVKTHAEHLVK